MRARLTLPGGTARRPRAGAMGRRSVMLGTLMGVAVLPVLARAQGPTRAVRPPTVYESLQMFSQVLNQVRVNHPDSLDAHVLLQAAVRGLVAAADPHSYVIPALRMNAEKEQALRSGRLHPVPMEFAILDGAPIVMAVAPGSSAARAGIRPGDELVAVAGTPVDVMSAMELDVQLAGPKGSPVRLTLQRRRADGSVAELLRDVKRGYVEGSTPVPAVMMLDSATGYVRVTTFADDRAADHLHAALAQLERQGMRRLVLDLRDNGGGSVAEAATIAGEFLPTGTVVYTATGRKAAVIDTGRVARSFWKAERRYPIVVMINEGTASASELVAGALQDHDRATIVGRPSFGKALLMSQFPLTDGSAVMLVIGHVRTPCGRVVQRQYRGLSRREYYRPAAIARDTASLPRCRTASGRTLYGGGGIHPDVVLGAPKEWPTWMSRLAERAIATRWGAAWIESNAAALGSVEAFVAADAMGRHVPAFREHAATEGVDVPAGPDVDAMLAQLLASTIAAIRWDEAARFRVEAATDPEIRSALEAFRR